MTTLYAMILAYIISSIPIIHMLTYTTTGVSLHETGTKNVGVANMFKNTSKKVGIIGVSIQALMTLIILNFSQSYLGLNRLSLFLILSSLILGNLFPLFNKFRGSKGRTIAGWGLLYLSPLSLVVGLSIWGILFYILKSSSKSMAIVLSLFPIVIYYFEKSLPISLYLFFNKLILLM